MGFINDFIDNNIKINREKFVDKLVYKYLGKSYQYLLDELDRYEQKRQTTRVDIITTTLNVLIKRAKEKHDRELLKEQERAKNRAELKESYSKCSTNKLRELMQEAEAKHYSNYPLGSLYFKSTYARYEFYRDMWTARTMGGFRQSGNTGNPYSQYDDFGSMNSTRDNYDREYARRQHEAMKEQARREEEYRQYQQRQRQREREQQQRNNRYYSYNSGSSHNYSRARQAPPKQHTQIDVYTVLGCASSDTVVVIKKTYRAKVIQYHPDRYTSQQDKDRACKEFLKIQKAYDKIKELRGIK